MPQSLPPPHPPDFTPTFWQGLIRYQNGQWLVTASYRTADNNLLQTADFVLLPDSLSLNPNRNPLAPKTVKAVDANRVEHTIICGPFTGTG
ncbi:MAG: hypothetical protein RMJ60_05145 [Anaerolineales bacterium]|nr:hypothetical protein [Anaerolineales bacterium]